MKRRLLLILATIASGLLTCHASTISGSWRGELNLGQYKMPIVFNFSEDADGKTGCTIDSPSQGVKGIATQVTKCTADSIIVDCKMIGANFAARIAGNTMDGVFTQRGASFPLTLTPEATIEDRRPQTPKPPYPYSVTDTIFCSADGTELAATLTVPTETTGKKIPAVIMVTGSGPQNRDEEILDHKPFAVIADYLSRHGIASLRYDDRGIGQSKGDFRTSTTYTFKDDAAAAIEFLRTIPQVSSVGVIGHSEGGTIAFMLGAEKKADFIISLAGMAVSAKETLIRQNNHLLELSGMAGQDKENSLKLISLLFDKMAEQARNNEFTSIDVDKLVAESGLTVSPAIIANLKQTAQTRTPWFDTLLSINPSEWLSEVSCPVIAINGDKDTQVDAGSNLNIIKEMIPGADVRLMQGLNHLMQHAATGEAYEYEQICETISPEVLELILTFCRDK